MPGPDKAERCLLKIVTECGRELNRKQLGPKIYGILKGHAEKYHDALRSTDTSPSALAWLKGDLIEKIEKHCPLQVATTE